jgi:hypothetical protein
MKLFSANRKSFGLALLSLALHGFVWQGQAQIVLSHRNSTAIIDPGPGQNGMFHWDIQGQNQLAKQWFWYSVGASAPASIDTISAPAITPGLGSLAGRYVDITYGNAGFNISIEYLLTGGSVAGVNQVASADLTESISINNTSGGPLTFHFYQFSDFNLGGTPTTDSISLGTDPFGLYNSANQSDGFNSLSESVTTANPSASHGEAALAPLTLNKLNNGFNPVVLNDNPTAGPGNVTWAFEWDMVLDPGSSFLLSKDKQLHVQIIPEPAILGLLSLATFACWCVRSRRKD